MHSFRWHKDMKFYEVSLYPDLLGDWVVVRSWGSLIHRAGRRIIEQVTDELTGIEKIKKIKMRRVARGYRQVPIFDIVC